MAAPLRTPGAIESTPRIKFQFRNLDRAMRHEALKTIFSELNAASLHDRLAVIRRIEQIVFVHRCFPKTHYKTIPSRKEREKWASAVHKHSSALAALVRDCPYGDNWFPTTFGADLDDIAKRHNPGEGNKPERRGRPAEGLHWLVDNLAGLYWERTGKPPGFSRKDGEVTGPFVRVVESVCALMKLDKSGEAIADAIKNARG